MRNFMGYKVYLKILFATLGFIFMSVILYAYYFAQHYPLPITDRISFDAKIKFIRDKIDTDKVDTLIIGSSIGLNDIQGSYLEKFSKNVTSVVNLSVYEATTLEAEQLLELSDTFPNLKRIIYSAQYSDFPHITRYKNYKPQILIQYMRHELGWIDSWLLMFHACRNIYFCMQRQNVWEEKHMQPNKFEYLGFDKTGSVPLHIYGKDIIGHRWRLPQPGIMHPESFAALSRMVQYANNKKLKFYLAHQPYRQPLYEKYKKVRDAMDYFDNHVRDIFMQHNGYLIVLQNLHLSDAYFADRTHLNDKGSIMTAEAIGKFIDKQEK